MIISDYNYSYYIHGWGKFVVHKSIRSLSLAEMASWYERNLFFDEAAEHWHLASINTKSKNNKNWAEARSKLCTHLAEQKKKYNLPSCYDLYSSRVIFNTKK